MEEKKHFIYVILTQNNKLYCGYTNDVKARYKKHVEGKGAKFTRANKPKALVFQKESIPAIANCVSLEVVE